MAKVVKNSLNQEAPSASPKLLAETCEIETQRKKGGGVSNLFFVSLSQVYFSLVDYAQT